MRLSRPHRPDAKLTWLASLPWWGDLPRGDLEALAGAGDRVTVPTDRRIMVEGERGRESAIVVVGEVEVTHGGEVLARLGPGDVVGELSLLDHAPRTADVRATTPVELLVFTTREMQRVLTASAAVRDRVTADADSRR